MFNQSTQYRQSQSLIIFLFHTLNSLDEEMLIEVFYCECIYNVDLNKYLAAGAILMLLTWAGFDCVSSKELI